MYLLYLDDSGSVGNEADRHIVLGGVALFERQPHWFSEGLETIARRLWPENPQGLEFRGSDVLGGKKHWRGIDSAVRTAAYAEALDLLGNSQQVHIFAAVIHKESVVPDDPMEFAFEQVCNRFDRFLGRLHKKGDTQRGLIILDKSSYETSLQRLAREFRDVGHRWGQLHNLSEVPLFVDSRATRMIQYADLVAHAVRRYYERGDSALFDRLSPRFDRVGGVLHGLVHYTPQGAACACFACRQTKKIAAPLSGA